ncbi:MAG: DUF3300 domain-containing protein [Burkholderiaceae bacterium]|nr:DUF3300 domain-containing protein [Burkholderiaceae bacterium]
MDTPTRAAQRLAVHAAAAISVALLGCVLTVAPAAAQTWSTAAQDDPPPAVVTARYTSAQLDQMLAPLALYPDDLLGQILMAATYPLEIVEADRWLQQPANASLRGTALAQALQSLPWDASVKSLVAYPPILAWMDSGLDWTEAVGEAFLAQQPDVMDSVQRLRVRAKDAGGLSSSQRQTVTTNGQDIEIASPDQSVLYVPVYDPDTVYGPWPYPDYPPYDFAMPGYAPGTFIVLPILIGYWGWDRCDWRHHRIDIVGVPGGQTPRQAPQRPSPQQHPVAWQYDPAHRHNVPYNNPTLSAKFEAASRLGVPGSKKPARAPSAATRPADRAVNMHAPEAIAVPMPSPPRSTEVLSTQPQPMWQPNRSAPAVPPQPPHPAPALVETPALRAESPPRAPEVHAPEVHASDPRGAEVERLDRAPAPGDSQRH